MSTPQYFYGEPENMGRVSRLPVTSFEELVDTFLSKPVPIAMTRDELMALPEEKQNEIKRTRYIVPCAFKDNPSPRQTGKATDAHLACLDVDDATEARRILNAGFDKTLGDLNAIVWHTARSTQDKPRIRVVVPTLPFPIARYGVVVTAIAGLLGMNSLNKESRVPVQPMYLPVEYKESDFSPIVYKKTDGVPFDPAGIDGLTELTNVGIDILSEADLGDLAYLRSPLENLSRDEIVDALSKIPASCSMDEWIQVGMGLKHQFGEAGFAIWDDWSSTAPGKYDGTEKLVSRWKSMQQNPLDRVPVTIRSVVKIAVENGWNNRPMVQRIFDQARDWIRAETRSSQELLDQGTKRIAKIANVIGPIEQKILVADLHTTIRARGLRGPTAQDVEKEVRRLTAAATRAAAAVPPWASNIVFLTGPNMFYRPLDNRKIKREVMDLIHQAPTPDTPTCHYLIHDIGVPVVENVRYDPAQKKRIFNYDGVPYINSYRPSYIKADKSQMQEAQDMFLKHAQQLLRPREYRYLVDFIAYMAQNPGRKIRWALFIQSGMGAGKGFVAHVCQIVLGRTNVQRLAAEHTLEGAHNSWATGFLLTIMDEIRMFGPRRYAMGDRLKPHISDDWVSIRNLYEPVQTVPNVMNFMLFSNWHDALAIQPGERRYCCLSSPLQTRQQIQDTLGKAYFDHVWPASNRLAGGLRAFFENWKISPDFNAEGRAPQTPYMLEMARLTASPLHRAVQDTINDQPHALVRRDLVSVQALRALLPREGLPPFSDQGLASILREEGYQSVGRYQLDGSMHELWSTEIIPDAKEKAKTRIEIL